MKSPSDSSEHLQVWEQEHFRQQATYLGLTKAQRFRAYLAIAVFWSLGGFVMGRRGWSSGSRGVLVRLGLFAFHFLLTWAVVALLILVLDPQLLVSSRAGVETVLGVLPATIVAVLVLLLGSVAVVAQMSASTWGTRAPVALSLDDQLLKAVLRPLLLVIVTLFSLARFPMRPLNHQPFSNPHSPIWSSPRLR